MVTLLPEPDSPTTPSTSPSSRLRLTPSTARITPPALGKSTDRFSSSRRSTGLSFQLRVEGVAQSVANEVEGEDGDQNHQAGEGHYPPGAQDELAGVGQHSAPFRRRRLRAKSQEAERRRVEDRRRDAERCLDDEW